MTRAVVFVGPSLHGRDQPWPASIEKRPPAGKGDLLAAVLDGATSIGLVDGTFGDGAAVWHKEILFALDRGIRVLGAASMGALRAAECSAFGMIGIGSIYRDYAEGLRTADEDVAIVHGPAELGFPPVTEALVDIDATLEHLRARRLIGATVADLLDQAARSIHFKDRTWNFVFDAMDLRDPADRHIIRANTVNRKCEDAWLLVRAMADDAAAMAPPARSIDGAFNDTLFFQELRQEIAARPAGRATA
ncbi:MAG: hypothetical protein IPK59_07655 [Rhodospirillaceae bacterium]|nr:hypothetical protein [Rhodospirillaceae bacterium]